MSARIFLVLIFIGAVSTCFGGPVYEPELLQVPDVIIGDEQYDPGGGAPTLHLLRYVNLVNLDVISHRGEDRDSQSFRFWYSTTGATLRVSNTTALKAPLTATERLNLRNYTAVPPAAKEITGGVRDFWLSLIEDAPKAGLSHPTSAFASAQQNGNTGSGLAAAGALGRKSVSVYVLDGTLNDVNLGEMTFDVYSLLGARDDYSGRPELYQAEFERTRDGWSFYRPSIANFASATTVSTHLAIGFGGSPFSAPIQGRFCSLASPMGVIPAAGMQNRVIQATFVMRGTASSAAAAPGFRLIYLSRQYIHCGGAQFASPSGISAFNVPYNHYTRTLKLAWAVPSDLENYGDSQLLNHGINPGHDLRDYCLQFDLMQLDATDSGNVLIDSVYVQSIPRPESVIPSAKWREGTVPGFIDAHFGWQHVPTYVPGFAPGSSSIGPSAMTVFLGGGLNSGFVQLCPKTVAYSGFPSWLPDRFMRTTYWIRGSDPARIPSTRFLTLGYRSPVDLSPVVWGDVLDMDMARMTYTSHVDGALPGAFKDGTYGSVLEFYAPAEYPGIGAEKAILTPLVNLMQPAPAGGWPMNTWPKPTAAVSIIYVGMESLLDW